MIKKQKTKNEVVISLDNVVSFLTILSMIFYAGMYIGEHNANIKKNNEVFELQKQICVLNENKIKEINKYTKEIYELRIEIYSLRERLLNKKN